MYLFHFSTCFGHPCAHHQEEITVSMRHWCLSLCMGGVWSAGWIFNPTSRPDATHTEWQIPVSHRYSNFSWWWAHGCPKHVEKRNKYIKQKCTPSWIYLQDCTRMHGQQNINLNNNSLTVQDNIPTNNECPSYANYAGLLNFCLLRP